MNILIIEDEIRASKQLQAMLQNNFSEMKVLEVLESVEDSVEWFNQNDSPDLILMDVQLADGLSFEIFQKTSIEAPVIFTTAYDQYSIKAFKVNSIDYLLKPIQENDLANAIKKYKKYHEKQSNSNINSAMVEQLLQNLSPDKSRKRFMVKEGSSMTFVQIDTILFFYSEDGISFLVNNEGKRYIVDQPLDTIEKEIDHNNFFRINRGQIVKINAVEKIHPYFNHRLKLDIKENSKLDFIVSRNRTSDFKAWVNQ